MQTKRQNPSRIPPEPTEAEIQRQAYHLWIDGGRLEGVEVDNWHAAREILRHRAGHALKPRPSRGRPAHRPLETFN